jgi:hypothetical protein
MAQKICEEEMNGKRAKLLRKAIYKKDEDSSKRVYKENVLRNYKYPDGSIKEGECIVHADMQRKMYKNIKKLTKGISMKQLRREAQSN